MPKTPKTRDDLFAEVLEGADTGAGVGSSGSGSALAKRQRKSAAAAAKIESEIKNEIAALSSVASDPRPIAPPPGLAPPPNAGRGGGRGKPVPEDKVKAQCVAIRVALARYQDLVDSHPDRYGDIVFPELKDKMGLDELKRVLNEVENAVRARAGTFAFKSFMTSLPAKLEELSLAGAIPLNLVGLPFAVYGDEPPENPEFSAAEEYKFLVEELAIKYDALFSLSPELRFLGLVGGAIASVHQRNMTALNAYLAKNPTDKQPESPDV